MFRSVVIIFNQKLQKKERKRNKQPSTWSIMRGMRMRKKIDSHFPSGAPSESSFSQDQELSVNTKTSAIVRMVLSRET